MDEERAVKNIPVLHMIARPLEELRAQAEMLADELKECEKWAEIQVEESESMVGGGSLPGETLASYAVTIQPKEMSCEELSEKMRYFSTPVIAYIKDDKVWLDMRTVMQSDVENLKNCLFNILK